MDSALPPSAKAQHNPFLLARWSNRSLRGELAKRPSSRAYKWFEANTVVHITATAAVSLYIVGHHSIDSCCVRTGPHFNKQFRVYDHPWTGGHNAKCRR